VTERPRSVRRTLWGALVIAPILIAGPLLVLASTHVAGNHALYDFRGGLFNAGVAILHGHGFYQPAFLAHQAAIMHAGGVARGEFAQTAFSIPVYPAAANVAIVPLSLLPFWLSGTLYTLLSVAAMLAGMWLLGIRDRRCLALVMISWPFIYGLYLGAIGPFLVLGAGVAWRWRDRVWPPALAIASIVAAKIFPWPLGFWLLITRRFKALALSIAACLVITLGAWAVIGFHGLAQYPQMLANMSYLQEGRAVSVVTVLLVAGLSPTAASLGAFLIAGLILAGAWRIARHPGGDRRAFGLVVIAALTATPIVWEHYMVLLFVPVALASPRLSRLWLLPLCTPLIVVLSSGIVPDGHALQPYSPNALRTALLWLLIEAIVSFCLCTTAAQRRALSDRAAHLWPRLRPHSPPQRSPAVPSSSADLAA
jgi:hypothetical protein